jgi:hypothetical protein
MHLRYGRFFDAKAAALLWRAFESGRTRRWRLCKSRPTPKGGCGRQHHTGGKRKTDEAPRVAEAITTSCKAYRSLRHATGPSEEEN